jgi:UDP-N-acetyl-2-amino-2-deoxyglucuronate dehydrogenase
LPLQAGFVGCGNISDTHVRAAREAGVGIAAFFGRDPQKAEALAGRYGGRAFSRYDDFLAHRPMDFVMIGSPSGLHAEHGIAAVERGLHVLVEKPIDVSTARGEALVATAERAGVKLGVLFQDRLQPDLVRLRDFACGGGLGRVLVVSARVKWHRPPEYYSSSRWRGTLALDGGAALVNQGIHTVDLLWLLGPVVRVRGLTATVLHAIEGEDVALALLRFASGALGTLEATTAAFPGYPRRVEISGTEGTVVVEGSRVAAADLRAPVPGLVSAGDEGGSSAATAIVADATPHRRMVGDFARAIATGAAPACDGREALRSLAVVEAVYAAGRDGGTTGDRP